METALASVSYNPNNKIATDILNKLSRVEGVQITINYVLPEEEECPYSKEFQMKMDKAIKEVENGEVYRMKPNQTVEEFLDELCTL